MSYDAALIVTSAKGTGAFAVYDVNLTYNYQPAIAAAGLDSFSELHGMTAEEGRSILTLTLSRLKQHPEYGNLIRGGGTWGTMDTLQGVIVAMIHASNEWPEAVWSVS